jgi:regulator of replication initiation timing
VTFTGSCRWIAPQALLGSWRKDRTERDNFQKMYDEGIQIALKYFGERDAHADRCSVLRC